MITAAATALALLPGPAGAQAGESGKGNAVLGPSAPMGETAPSDGALVLSAQAVRVKLGMDVYRLSLYLPDPRLDYAYIASPDVAKVFRVDILYGGDLPDEVPDDWTAELVPATSDGDMAVLRDAYAALGEGDVIRIEYAPGAGSTVLINGDPIVETGDHRLAAAAAALWLGDDPASPEVRAAIFGGCGEAGNTVPGRRSGYSPSACSRSSTRACSSVSSGSWASRRSQ